MLTILAFSVLALAPCAAWTPTESTRRLRDVIVATNKATRNFTQKDFAFHAGLTEQQASDQLNLRTPLNLWRLANFPLAWLQQFQVELKALTGQRVFDEPRFLAVIEFAEEQQRTYTMLRMALPQDQDERKRA